MILDKIVNDKKIEIQNDFTIEYQDMIFNSITKADLKNSFSDSIKNDNRISIIAEIKKASPSKGIIKEKFDPYLIACEYDRSDIDAISVLTEKNYFSGSKDHLKKVYLATKKPILRKDFIIDERQIYESAYLGASAVLLIVSILTIKTLYRFIALTYELGLECVVEVHDQYETDTALSSGAKIIGINNRDLKTFDVSIQNTFTLLKLIPDDRIIVSESGISSKKDLDELYSHGVDAVLIGEVFMKADSISEEVKRFRYGN